MAEIYASRVRFTLMGAPPESFFIDSVKSIIVVDNQQNSPFVKMKPLPSVDTYLQYYENIDVEIKYFTKRDSSTFDFQTLPRIPGLPIQLTIYKQENIIATLSNIVYTASSILGLSPNRGIEMSVRFKASKITYNQYT